jgi:hypothetical protein
VTIIGRAYLDWQSYFITTSEAGPLETFSAAFLEPKISAAMELRP